MKMQIINEAMEVPGVNSDNRLETLIPDILNVISQIHVWHLLCKSGQKHTALGELYESLQTEVDELAEIYIGMGGSLERIADFAIDVSYEDRKVIAYLKTFKERIDACIESTSNASMLSLQSELIEIQELIYHFIYKFDLN